MPALTTVREIFLNRRGQLGERCRPAAHTWASQHLDVVLTRAEQPLQRREVRRLGTRLVSRDGGLCGSRAIRELELGYASGPAGTANEGRDLHLRDYTLLDIHE